MRSRRGMTAATVLVSLALVGCARNPVSADRFEQYARWLSTQPGVVDVSARITPLQEGETLTSRQQPVITVRMADGTSAADLLALDRGMREHQPRFERADASALVTVDGLTVRLGRSTTSLTADDAATASPTPSVDAADAADDAEQVALLDATRRVVRAAGRPAHGVTGTVSERVVELVLDPTQAKVVVPALLADGSPLAQAALSLPASRRGSGMSPTGAGVASLRVMPPGPPDVFTRGAYEIGAPTLQARSRETYAGVTALTAAGLSAVPGLPGAIRLRPENRAAPTLKTSAQDWARAVDVAWPAAPHTHLQATLSSTEPQRVLEIDSAPTEIAAADAARLPVLAAQVPAGVVVTNIATTKRVAQLYLRPDAVSSPPGGTALTPAQVKLLEGAGSWPLSRLVRTYTYTTGGARGSFPASGYTGPTA